MLNVINQLSRWVGRRWHSAGIALRIVYGLLFWGAVILLSLAIPMFPGSDWVKELFARSSPHIQFGVLCVLITLIIVIALLGLQRNSRVSAIEEENAQLTVRLSAAEAEVQQYQARMNHLLDVEARAGLWKRECQVPAPQFVSPLQRKTRFLTVLNLKGGVGKTTLTANLAACLGLTTPSHRVLLIDIDFQGTLGDAAVERTRIEAQRQHRSFVNLLLTTPEADDSLLERLAVPMSRVPGAQVVLATDTLDTDEFQLQAQFFINGQAEPRFRFRRHLHREAIFNAFDYVIFDCPPRITTSVVNAMLCSDYVLIPTRLDRGSIDAVPRTWNWMQSLGSLCPVAEVGVVASHAVVRSGRMTKADRQSYEALRGVVQSMCGRDLLFQAVVPATPHAIGPDRGLVASLDSTGRMVFTPFVEELQRRMER